jgi:NAD(P)H-flavin reductase
LFITKAPVKEVIRLENDIFILKIYSPEIASIIKPGEFLNVRVSQTTNPLLRRPFSICDVEGDYIFLMFSIFGEGTRILSSKHKGEIATEDGSLGFKGNVVDLLKQNINNIKSDKVKIFACGPNAMLSSLKKLCVQHNLDCEASTECAMACGFGICQGCPIESTKNSDNYLLVCKDGPVFNISDVVI